MQQTPTLVELTVHLQDYLQNMQATPATAVPPHTVIKSIQLLQHHRLQKVYQVNLSDNTVMLVVMPPPPMARLLRSEKNMIKSEAAVIRWVREEASRKQQPHPWERTAAPQGPASPGETEDLMGGGSPAFPTTGLADNPTAYMNSHLLRYLPSPVHRSVPVSSPSPLAPSSLLEFNVITPPPGTPISMLPTPLTAEERDCVDYEAGKLVHQLSRLSSRSGYFGPALAVLAPESVQGRVFGHGNATTDGMTSWSVAFHSLLESILRDGEDMAVALAYPTIRKQFRRLGHLLDTVRTPSLVVVDAVDDTNLLVQRLPAVAPTEDGEDGPKTSGEHGHSSLHLFPTALMGQQGERNHSHCPFSCCNATGSMSPPSTRLGPEPGPGTRITVTGLRDWSHCVFGDPLFASVFHKEPSEPFLRGFGYDRKDFYVTSPEYTPTTHGQGETKKVRLLLYRCYHAVVQIVKGFYRLDGDHTTRELAARKQLTEALSLLEAISDSTAPKNGHRRPTGESSLAKKPRSESGEESSTRPAATHSPASLS